MRAGIEPVADMRLPWCFWALVAVVLGCLLALPRVYVQEQRSWTPSCERIPISPVETRCR